MRKSIRAGFILATTLAASVGVSFGAGVVEVNSTCITTSCSPGTLSAGQSDSGTFNTDVNINGDVFNVAGSWLDTLNAAGTVPQVNLNDRVTLVSVAGGGALTSTTDVSIIDLLDKFVWPYSSDSFFEKGTFSFGPTLGSGSQAEARLTVDGTNLPLLGPFFPYATQTGTASMVVNTPDNPLPMQLEDLFIFGAGTTPGAYIQEGLSPVIPEPGYAIPVVAAIFGLVLLKRHREARRHQSDAV